MNFTIVTDTFPPDINGVARTVRTLAQGLARRGHSMNVISTTSGIHGDASDMNLRCTLSLPLPGYDGIRVGLATKRWLRRQIESSHTDAMYVAVETLLGLNAINAARASGVGVVSGFHTNFHTYSSDYRLPLLQSLAEHYLRWIHNRAHRTLTPSETTATQLRNLGIRNVGVLGRGVDTELFRPSRRDPDLRREWGADESTPVAILVSRMAAEKNLPLAVKTFHRLMQINPATRCVFVGDGPKAKWLKQEHPEFIHAGARTGEELARHYASADIFVFPSLTETFGNVLTEAMASGLITVGFDYAAAHQFVQHGENGFVATRGDESKFIAAASEGLFRWRDAGIRQAARATAMKLSWNAIIDQFENELLQTVNRPAHA